MIKRCNEMRQEIDQGVRKLGKGRIPGQKLANNQNKRNKRRNKNAFEVNDLIPQLNNDDSSSNNNNNNTNEPTLDIDGNKDTFQLLENWSYLGSMPTVEKSPEIDHELEARVKYLRTIFYK